MINLYNLQDLAAARRARFEELAEKHCLVCACSPERRPVWCRALAAVGAGLTALGRRLLEASTRGFQRVTPLTAMLSEAGPTADEIDLLLKAGPHRPAGHPLRL